MAEGAEGGAGSRRSRGGVKSAAGYFAKLTTRRAEARLFRSVVDLQAPIKRFLAGTGAAVQRHVRVPAGSATIHHPLSAQPNDGFAPIPDG